MLNPGCQCSYAMLSRRFRASPSPSGDSRSRASSEYSAVSPASIVPAGYPHRSHSSPAAFTPLSPLSMKSVFPRHASDTRTSCLPFRCYSALNSSCSNHLTCPEAEVSQPWLHHQYDFLKVHTVAFRKRSRACIFACGFSASAFSPALPTGGSRERAAGGAAVGACAKAPGRTEADATLHAISIDASDRHARPRSSCGSPALFATPLQAFAAMCHALVVGYLRVRYRVEASGSRTISCTYMLTLSAPVCCWPSQSGWAASALRGREAHATAARVRNASAAC
eukprot:4267984-Pleurochrysis_carterae.AAC.2